MEKSLEPYMKDSPFKSDILSFFKKLSPETQVDYNLYNEYFNLIKRYHTKEIESGNDSFTEEENSLFHDNFKLLGYVRDIQKGLGCRDLSYMMICVWYQFYPESTKLILNDIFTRYGSWVDVRLLANYYSNLCSNTNIDFYEYGKIPELIDYSLDLMIEQLKYDYGEYYSFDNMGICNISNVAKWVPREKNKRFGWLYPILAKKFNVKVWDSKYKSNKKLFKAFREVLSTLNKYLQTVEIYQTNNDWELIDFNKVSVTTQKKQNNAFLNLDSNGQTKWKHSVGRDVCSHNYKHHKLNKYLFNTIKYYPTDEELINLITTIDSNTQRLEMRNYDLYEEINHLWKKNYHFKIHNSYKNIVPITDSKSIVTDCYSNMWPKGKNSNSSNVRLIALFLRLQEYSNLNNIVIVDKYEYKIKETSLSGKVNILLKILQGETVNDLKKRNLKSRSDFNERHGQSVSFIYLYNNIEERKYKSRDHPLPKQIDLEFNPVIFYINFYNSSYIKRCFTDTLPDILQYHSYSSTNFFHHDSNYNNNFYNNFKKHIVNNGVKCSTYNEYKNLIDTVDNERYKYLSPY